MNDSHEGARPRRNGDLVVEDLVLVELKSVENLAPMHYKQSSLSSKLRGFAPSREPHFP